MSGIDAVVAQSQRSGDFVERRQLTVERSDAIRKMRQFVLPEPAHYILELVQGAVANNATLIDVRIIDRFATISWFGDGFERVELDALFDYLFASGDEVDVADLRHIAIGLNALLMADPKLITLVSGRGTVASTTRVEIDGRKGTLNVGTPTIPLNGTLIRADGLNRRHLGKIADGEELALQMRCHHAPVPILFNLRAVQGSQASRTPVLNCSDDTVLIDEDDLYGALGWRKHRGKIDIVTYGVHVTSVAPPWAGPFAADCGVIHYNRLRKSADQQTIVRDEVWDEMWQRLEIYAQKDRHLVAELDGGHISVADVRRRAASVEQVVVIPKPPRDDAERGRARWLEALFGPEIWVVDRALGRPLWLTRWANVVWADLRAVTLNVYDAAPAERPAKPWLTGPIRREDVALDALLGDTASERWTASLYPATSRATLTVYTPKHDEDPETLKVDLLVRGRAAWSGEVPSATPGQHVVVDLTGVVPSALSDETGGYTTLRRHAPRSSPAGRRRRVTVGDRLAVELEAYLRADMALASRRVLVSAHRDSALITGAEGRAWLRRLALNLLADHVYLAVTEDGVALKTSTDLGPVLREQPLFTTHTGEAVTLRDLEGMLNEHTGLVYTARPDMTLVAHAPQAPQGESPANQTLHTSQATPQSEAASRLSLSTEAPRLRSLPVVVLDAPGEDALARLISRAVMVPVDTSEPADRVGDVFLGDLAARLRPFAEGEQDQAPHVPAQMLAADAFETVRHLRARLDDRVGRRLDQQARRRAWRELVWFVTLPGAQTSRAWALAADAPLFVTRGGRYVSFAELEGHAQKVGHVTMADGWAQDPLSTRPSHDERPEESLTLAMHPFVLRLLRRRLRVERASPLDAPVGWLWSVTVRHGSVRGRMGIPAEPSAPRGVWIQTPDGSVPLTKVNRSYPVAGALIADRAPPDDTDAVVHEQLERGLLAWVTDLDGAPPGTDRDRRVREMLAIVSTQLRLERTPLGGLLPRVSTDVARRLLRLPLLPLAGGGWSSVGGLVERFALAQVVGSPTAWSDVLDRRADPAMVRFCEHTLVPERVVRPPTPRGSSLVLPGRWTQAALGAWLSRVFLRATGAKTHVLVAKRVFVGLVTWEEFLELWRPLVGKWEVGRDAKTARQVHASLRFVGAGWVADTLTPLGRVLVLDANHEVVRRVLEQPVAKDRALLLAMAVYGALNANRDEVTDHDELAFHALVAQWLLHRHP